MPTTKTNARSTRSTKRSSKRNTGRAVAASNRTASRTAKGDTPELTPAQKRELANAKGRKQAESRRKANGNGNGGNGKAAANDSTQNIWALINDAGLPKVTPTIAGQAFKTAEADKDAKPTKAQRDRVAQWETKKAGLAGKALALWVLTGDSNGGKPVQGSGGTAQAPSKPAEPKWPKDPAKLLLEYLQERVSDTFDPEHEARPYINSAGRVFIHSTDWREWLASKHDFEPSKQEASKPMRDRQMVMRAAPLPGLGRGLGFYQGPAPEGTEGLPRRASGTRQSAASKPLGGLTDTQVEALTKALTAYDPKGRGSKALRDARDELLVLLPASS